MPQEPAAYYTNMVDKAFLTNFDIVCTYGLESDVVTHVRQSLLWLTFC